MYSIILHMYRIHYLTLHSLLQYSLHSQLILWIVTVLMNGTPVPLFSPLCDIPVFEFTTTYLTTLSLMDIKMLTNSHLSSVAVNIFECTPLLACLIVSLGSIPGHKEVNLYFFSKLLRWFCWAGMTELLWVPANHKMPNLGSSQF